MKYLSSILASCLFVALPHKLFSNELDLFELSLEQLLNVEVTTASNRKEKLADSPATVVVLTQNDLLRRGYENLSEIFTYLPGMEVVRGFGDVPYLNYMRGFRNTFGTPYLIMIDGKTINNLYFNKTSHFATIPLTSVEQIEVVYGPASSLYGVNAFMGVVNVITKKASNSENSLHAINTFSADGGTVFDYSGFYNSELMSARFSIRIENADLEDRIDNNQTYWLRDELNSTELWGDFVTQGMISEHYHSPIRNLGFDTYLEMDKLAFGWRYHLEDSGYGMTYAGDKLNAEGNWPIYQHGGFINFTTAVNDNLISKSELTYQSDGADGEAYDIEAWNVNNPLDTPNVIGGVTLSPNESARMLHFTRWYTNNEALSFKQQFDYSHNNVLKVVSGFQLTDKDMQKAYVLAFSEPISPLTAIPQLPEPVTEKDDSSDNRIHWRESAAFIQGKYAVNANNDFHLGYRLDDNSHYGINDSFRTALVHRINEFNFKLLYGEAFHAPTPRTLYGGWTGAGSDTKLKPEQSNTLEATVRYDQADSAHLLSFYQINMNNTIVAYRGGARNLGQRQIVGMDYHYTYRTRLDNFGEVDIKAYLTHYFSANEKLYDSNTAEYIGTSDIGDIAKTKLWLIADWRISEQWSMNLLSRFIDSRKTISSNPIDKIPGFTIADLNITYQDLTFESLSLSLKITNLFDTQYFHPGIRTADAGEPLLDSSLYENIGFSNDDPKAWQGSLGWYNSRLPQPERRFTLSLILKF